MLRQFTKTLLGSLSALSFSACAPVTMLNAMVPESGYQHQADIIYGDHERLKLDIYQPVGLMDTQNPATVVFFYGGGWEAGEKADYKFVAEALTSQGIIVVIPDYRVFPEVLFPVFIEDAAKAVAWTIKHIAEFGGDPDQLFIGGHSAGAHIAAMLSVNPEYLQQVGLQPRQLRGMFGLAGPYDFLPLKSNTLKQIFGDDASQWQSQPVNFIREDHPPTLLLVGKNDRTVLPRNSYRLAEKLKKHGNSVELVEFNNYGHVAMVAKLAKPLRGDGALLRPIVNFVEKHR
ncbi:MULTISPECIES: alpha/beta hydrolase [unclassified Methylophaga]|uniref:alpha/beta hydrolase n=1 Tax=unclassified Methylophaga TaxID=2629249 RepID=UPI0025E45B89|nr:MULTISPECIES: alpha/beta hydrolase [unclassified Methylophaga]